MAYRYDRVNRLEPTHIFADLPGGLAAAVADPVWFLGRQWQLGEHQGEDAASPVQVGVRAGQVPLDPYDGDPALDPRVVPAEAIIEAEPGGWWTVGRRARLGAAAAPSLPTGAHDDLRFHDLIAPYDRLNGRFDGRAIYARRTELGVPASVF